MNLLVAHTYKTLISLILSLKCCIIAIVSNALNLYLFRPHFIIKAVDYQQLSWLK